MDQYKELSGNLFDVAVWLIAFKTMSNEHLVRSFWSRIWHWLETNGYIILMISWVLFWSKHQQTIKEHKKKSL